MPNASRKNQRQSEEDLLTTLPWKCTHFGDISEIEAFVSGRWETVAEIHSVGNYDAEDLADFIIRAVREYGQRISKPKN